MQTLDVFVAKDAEHAAALLAEHAPRAKVLAGGTDLLVDYKSGPKPWDVLIDISRAADLQAITLTDEGLSIGAGVTHTQIMRSPEIREHAPALIDAAHSIGAVQTRNLGTIGGNLVTCVPSMDSGPALLALDAAVTVRNASGLQRWSLAEFFVGPRKTKLAVADLLVDIVIPRRNLGKPLTFLKFGLRKGQALALVNVAAGFRAEKGVFHEPAIALGAVAPTVIRATEAEAYLAARSISDNAMLEAGCIAAQEAKPISDFRASADYRRSLIAVLTERALRHSRESAPARQVEMIA
ncbi:MAG: FAD binding domain-containing protein [Rhodoplanes sp.]